jgi:delta 1-pyrroline-5-carboxylate dehydrogenase
MTTTVSRISQAQAAWEAWNHLGFTQRSERLKKLASELPALRDAKIQALLRQLLDRTITLEPIQVMPGPTGESNELYLNGRGVVLVSGDSTATEVAMVGQLMTALACGNCVLLQWPEHQEWAHSLVEKAHMFGLPDAVIQYLPETDLQQTLTLDGIAVIAAVCTPEQAREINRQLAQRNGLLVQLVAETDPQACTHLLQPDHLLRFVTERTRTINTTAVGGNATLLELGSTEL